MDRATRLDKQFEAIITGRSSLAAQNSANFIDAFVAQPNVITGISRILSSKAGVTSLQACLRFDLSPTFFNGRATSLLKYLQHPDLAAVNGGQYLLQVLEPIVEPPIFWASFAHAFRSGQLKEEAQLTFAWLLFEVTSMAVIHGKTFTSNIANDTAIMDLIQKSPHVKVRDIGAKILALTSSIDNAAPANGVHSAGGRHDNDFADFRKISILPTEAEIRCEDRPFLRVKACLDDPETENSRLGIYLDNEFRLLREEMLYEMKEELVAATAANKKSKKGQQKVHRKGLIIDELTIHDIFLGPEGRRCNWGLAMQCKDDFSIFKAKEHGPRVQTLKENPSKPFRHLSWSCLLIDDEVAAFPTLYREESLLANDPPVLVLQMDGEHVDRTLMDLKRAQTVRLIILDTAVFSFEPVLKAIQEMSELPLSRELLFWKDFDVLQRPVGMPADIVNKIQAKPQRDLQSLLNTDKSIVLDQSQHSSLVSALTQRVSLIQGPPGTGKSFIGALLAKILHDHTQQNILVVCYTNHALDQFLEDLLDIGIPATSLIRLGAKSSTRTSSLMRNNQRISYKRDPSSRALIDMQKSEAEKLIGPLTKSFAKLKDEGHSPQEILEYIEFEDWDYFEAFCVPPSNDGMTIAGPDGKPIQDTYLLEQWRNGRDAGIFKGDDFFRDSPIWSMPVDQRKARLARWIQEMTRETVVQFHSKAAQYNSCQKHLARYFSEKDNTLVSSKRIIGCTTTAAAKYSEQIRQASPEVLLVEEAGEILESHILTATNPNTKQLILIGDHQQLRPKVNNYSLTVEKGEGYDLNMSLFERLVLKGYPHETLSQQHRMRPEISALIRQLTYPHLIDAPKTKGRPQLRGVQDVLVFINHSHPEDETPHIAERRDMGSPSSKQNTYEVEMVLKILRYLAQQGYGTNEITVLTPYLAQLQNLRTTLMNDSDPILNDLDSFDLIRAGLPPVTSKPKTGKKAIRLATIDNYQGEESDIIIASLTRSNSAHNIGFMSAPERLNVLLSRARIALILIGNTDTFVKSKKGGALWSKLNDLLKAGGHIYDGFPARCERHPDQKVILKNAIDFDIEVPDGGCKKPCGAALSCGQHICHMKCHRITDHSNVKCKVIVDTQCPKGHTISWKCSGKQPTTCKKCAQEDEKEERKKQKAFELQQQRDAEQLAHARALVELEEQIVAEQQRVQDEQLRKQRKSALEQKRKDLDNARLQTGSQSTVYTPPPPPPPPSPSPTSPPSYPPTQPNTSPSKPQAQAPRNPAPQQPIGGLYAPVVSSVPTSTTLSPSEAEWQRQKQVDGANNQAIDDLMKMTGLETVKDQVLKIKMKIDLAQRQNLTLQDERFNITMLGNPGTGKTTVARLYAKFLASVNVLPGNKFIETTGSRVSDGGVKEMKQHIDNVLKAGGGAIFVDEAYQLVSGENTHGKEVLNFMLAEMENNVGKVVFILAGYRKEMEKFFEHNPGLPSRVPYQLQFEDYTDAELLLMLRRMIVERYGGCMKVEGDIHGLYGRIAIRRLGRGRGKEGFGNARALQNMFQKVTERQAARIHKERVAGKSPDDFLLLGADLIGPKPGDVLKDNLTWKKLQTMVGLQSVKNAIQAFFDTVSTNYQRELQEKEPMAFSLNKIFTGSPGTGKTTVAKLYGQILADLGLLSSGEVIVKNPSDFTGAYIGHSERNTKGILASTVGKVLVIDEAYMLYGGGSSDGGHTDSFKTAVIDTIVAEVQNTPGDDRCVLLLGYKEQMMAMFQARINVNPGFKRRFDVENPFHFDDFSEPELGQILDIKLKAQDLDATQDAKSVAMDVLSRARNRPKFGNGGDVENLVTQAKLRFQQRHGHLPVDARPVDVVLGPQDFDQHHDRAKHATTNLQKLFEDVIGCDDIVKKLGDYQTVAGQMKARGMDARKHIPMNFIFKGPPEVVECSASDLVGKYVGHTGPKVLKLFEKALGSVLFIDEAYRLGSGHFAQEAIDEIVGLMTQERFKDKLIVILAGYDDDMNQLLSVNTGLSMLDKLLRKEGIIVEEVADTTTLEYQKMHDLIDLLSATPSWGNVRDIVTISKQSINLAFTVGDTFSRLRGFQPSPPLLSPLNSQGPPPSSAASATDKSPANKAKSPPPPPPPDDVSESSGKTSSPTESKPTSTPPTSPSAPPSPKSPQQANSPESGTPVDQANVRRDAGVSDKTWRQLQRDKAAEIAKKQKEEETARQLEESRKQEEEAKRRLEQIAEAEKKAKEEEQRRTRGSRRLGCAN
ncbi:hypothetical protein VNI00_003093 [Paramarasmius palmivorus]|uniref:AAA+ ATPase domain-containing protein n=1 Tax=Paramarasmius palmivorus TaxID=297713 RepID=A0AAW0DUA9_9AGAR